MNLTQEKQGSASVTGTVTTNSPITTATPYSVTLTVADTEYSQALPANTRYFEFQARTAADVRWAFVTGKVAGPVEPYRTLKSGNNYYSPDVDLTGITLYLGSAVALTVVELLVWS